MKLCLSKLNPVTTAADISAHFSPFTISHLSRVHTIADVGKLHFRTYCFIDIEPQDDGIRAIGKYDGSTLLGAVIAVRESK